MTRPNRIRALFSDTVVYGFGSIAMLLVSFLLMPVYTRAMSVEQYGAYSVLRVALVVLNILFDVAFSSTIVRFYFDKDDEAFRRRLFGTSFLFVQGVAAGLSIVLLAVSPLLSRLIVGPGPWVLATQLTILCAWAGTGTNVPLALYRAKGQPWRFIALTLANVVIMVGLTFYLCSVLHLGAAGAIGAMVIANVATYIASLPITVRNSTITIDRALLTAMLAFSLPLVPHALAAWILSFADRLLLRSFEGLKAAGIYAIGYTIGSVMNMAVMAVQKSWPQFIYSAHAELEEDRAKGLFVRTANYYLMGMCAFGLALALGAPQVLVVMSRPAYYAAAPVVPWVVAGYLFFGLYTVMGLGVGIKKRSTKMFVATGWAAALNVALNIVLIPRLGILGPAITTAVSYFVMATIIYVVSQRLYPVRFQLGRMTAIGAAAVACFLLGTYFAPGIGVGTGIRSAAFWAAVGTKALAWLVFVVFLFVTGLITAAERRRMFAWLGGLVALPRPGVAPAAGPEGAPTASTVSAGFDASGPEAAGLESAAVDAIEMDVGFDASERRREVDLGRGPEDGR